MKSPPRPDLFFLISNMKIYFKIEKEFDREQLEEVLAKKTLLLDTASVQKTDKEVKEDYSFPFKLASSEEIFNLAENKDKNSLYIKLGLEYKGKSAQTKMIIVNFMIIDCETGKILSRCGITGLGCINWAIPIGMDYYYAVRLYTSKAKLKGLQLRWMSSKKKQLKFFKQLTLY